MSSGTRNRYSGKNRIIDNPFDMDILDMIIESSTSPARLLGKEKKNWVKRLPDQGQLYMNKHMDCFKGRWEFEFFHSEVNVLYHTYTILGNDGDLGFILPIDWRPWPEIPETIMYNWWSDRRVMYAGKGEIRYEDTGELALIEKDIQLIDLKFKWSLDKALIFDCKQLHSAKKFDKGWKEFIIGFVV